MCSVDDALYIVKLKLGSIVEIIIFGNNVANTPEVIKITAKPLEKNANRSFLSPILANENKNAPIDNKNNAEPIVLPNKIRDFIATAVKNKIEQIIAVRPNAIDNERNL